MKEQTGYGSLATRRAQVDVICGGTELKAAGPSIRSIEGNLVSKLYVIK